MDVLSELKNSTEDMNKLGKLHSIELLLIIVGKKWINTNNVKLRRQAHRHQTIEKKRKTMCPKYLKVHSFTTIKELSNQNTTNNTEKFKNF